MIWLTFLPAIIADPLREFLTRGAKRALPTVEEQEKGFELSEKQKDALAREIAARIIKENLK